MRNLFRILAHLRRRKVKIVIVDPSHPDETHHTEIVPDALFKRMIFLIIVLIGAIGLFLYVSPLGDAIYHREDPEIARTLIEIGNKLESLKDTIQIREYEMEKMKAIMVQNADTIFTIDESLVAIAANEFENAEDSISLQKFNSNELSFYLDGANFQLTDDDLITIDQLDNEKNLVPFNLPIKGSISRDYEVNQNHFGIDIAAESGSYVRAIAEGAVIQSQWTWNFGHVIVIQHKEGYLSIYKHLMNSNKIEGDLIARGDVIGQTGKVGLITTGPHLHLEIWKNGLPINPLTVSQ
jgi:murein DD-endopeptidase MepM/ murein hydrolase activator NlpD